MRQEFADSERELGDYFTSAIGLSAQNIDTEPGKPTHDPEAMHVAMREEAQRRALTQHDRAEATLRATSPEHRATLRLVFMPRGESSILHAKMRRVEERRASCAASKVAGEDVMAPGSTSNLLGVALHTRAAKDAYAKFLDVQTHHRQLLRDAWQEAIDEWRAVVRVSGWLAAGPRPKEPAMPEAPSRDGLLRFLEWEAGRESHRLFTKIRAEATHTLNLALAAYDALRLARIVAERTANAEAKRRRIGEIYARAAA